MDEFMQASTPLAHELTNSALRLCCITTEVTVKMPFKFSSEECDEEYMGVRFVYRFCSDIAIYH
jgi:hypothetical protein